MQRRWQRVGTGLGLVIAGLLCAAPGGLAQEPVLDLGERERVRMAQYDPEDTWTQGDILVLGARVFDNRCSPCHGEQGFGDGELADVLPLRPRNYHSEPFKWGNSPARIATTVAAGRSGIMPPFKSALTEQEIWAVAYVVWRWVPKDQRSYDTREEALQWRLP
jgi:mono/diheme cytochrome c family protein